MSYTDGRADLGLGGDLKTSSRQASCAMPLGTASILFASRLSERSPYRPRTAGGIVANPHWLQRMYGHNDTEKRPVHTYGWACTWM